MIWRVFSLSAGIIGRVAFFVVLVMAVTSSIAAAQVQESNRDSPAVMDEPQAAPVRPIPRGWKIAIVAIVAVGSGFALAFSVRAWRSSNLFDRQYRFPPVVAVGFRLGANRSGGRMVTIEFGHRAK
jgi:hypothetical protein